MHGNDPPLYQYLGSPQILCRFADFDRLFSEVPSKHNGMTFCCGTRYESGEDVFEGIRHFGSQGKLLHVHFRNVRGTLPKSRGYAEVFVDDGDMPMAKVVRALDAVGYDGVIDYDHPISVAGDGPLPKQYIAFAVGYMRRADPEPRHLSRAEACNDPSLPARHALLIGCESAPAQA